MIGSGFKPSTAMNALPVVRVVPVVVIRLARLVPAMPTDKFLVEMAKEQAVREVCRALNALAYEP